MAYRVQPAARRDLDDILSWYRDEAGVAVARSLRDAFQHTFQRIGTPPFAHVRNTALLPDPYRFVLMDPYWIVCLPKGKRTVHIVRVLHARRDIARLLSVLA